MTDTTVLVIEDEKMLARAYERMLSDQYTVRIALSGMEGLEQVDDDVDVILLDRRMPEMSGDETLEKLAERGVDAKVAMLTAVDPDVDIVDLPFDDYRTKPVEGAGLLEAVESLLERREYDEQTQEFFRVAIKTAALEAGEKDMTDEYKRLTDRLAELHDQVEVDLDEINDVIQFDGLNRDVL